MSEQRLHSSGIFSIEFSQIKPLIFHGYIVGLMIFIDNCVCAQKVNELMNKLKTPIEL